jgi:hypothetical protein
MWDRTTTADLREQIKPYIDLLIRYVPSANILIIAILPKQYEGWTSEKQAEGLAARLNKFFSKPSYESLNYQGVLTVVANPNSKAGQSDLKQRLYDAAQQMIVNGQQIVGRQIPEAYFSLIPMLEEEQQIFRSKSKPGVLEESSIWMLFNKALASDPPDKLELPVMVDFLKEAGLLLHYEDPNDRLDQCYFTRPIWLYNTLLRVVHHALEHRSRLFLTHSELCSLANVSWSKDIAQALIRLMIRYAVVLPVRRDQYLITCLLPHSQPPTDILCGMLRRQFAPKIHSIPIDLWSRLLCSIISNLPRIIDMSKLKMESKSKCVETPLSEQPDAATGATESRTQKGIKEESPILPTATEQTLASRFLRRTSPVKHFSRDRSASSDPSQTPPPSSKAVNGEQQASKPQYSSEGLGYRDTSVLHPRREIRPDAQCMPSQLSLTREWRYGSLA